MGVVKKDFSLNASEKRFCVELAKKSIKHFLDNKTKLKLEGKELSKVPKHLLENKACFVTLMSRGELRGCIGHLKAIQQLYLDIIDNAVSAAVNDHRFPALIAEEFSRIKVEVSVLTDPKELPYSDKDDLLKKIVAGKDGLIISKGFRSATFLPSVWEQLPKKEDFLSELCMKAGLGSNEWVREPLKVETYKAIKAKE